jgi:hypothetical protein
MLTPVGFWAFVLGYALVYTGVSSFMGQPTTLAKSLGLTAPLQTALPAPTPTASTSTASNLAGGIQSTLAQTTAISQLGA